MTGTGAPPAGAAVPPDGGVPDQGEQPVVRIDRVGPGGGVPSDNAFGVALVTLWQRVADAGGPVGFAPPVVRSEVAARASGLVDEIRTGRIAAVVANRSHRLVGAGLLRPGRGTEGHTGHVELIMVDPAHNRAGLGGRLIDALIGQARERGLERVDLDAAEYPRLGAFLSRRGFAEWGRRPGWIRSPDGDDRDEIVWGLVL